MLKVYTVHSHSASKTDDTLMKTPRTSTISFLRNFARAYSCSPQTGTLIYN